MRAARYLAAAVFAVALAGPAVAQEAEDRWDSPVMTEQEERAIQEPVALADPDERPQRFSERQDSRLSVMAGAGVEGYLGQFRGEINPGPGWSVAVGGQATGVLGFEVGYSGAANDLDAALAGPGGETTGADIVRNGGHAALTLSAPTPAVQPYVMGGIGIDRYTFRGAEGAQGYSDDTSGAVPLGVGFRTGVGNFTADLRFNYDVLFNDEFSPLDTDGGDGRYSGLLHLGGRF
jgi:hypothetical protein